MWIKTRPCHELASSGFSFIKSVFLPLNPIGAPYRFYHFQVPPGLSPISIRSLILKTRVPAMLSLPMASWSLHLITSRSFVSGSFMGIQNS
jgi:hypothetical protein